METNSIHGEIGEDAEEYRNCVAGKIRYEDSLQSGKFGRVIPVELDIKTTSKIVGDGIDEDVKNSGCKHSISGNEGEIWLSLSTEADFPFALIAAE